MKSKFSLSINLVLVIIIMVLLSGTFASGANLTPGSATDPVVTQSYVENRITALNNEFDQRLTELENRPVGAGGSQTFVVMSLEAGQILNLEANSQFILRSGEAVAIAGQGGGLSDLTVGKDLATDETIQKNHLLLTPKTDGRGVKMTYAGWIMVSGGYSID